MSIESSRKSVRQQHTLSTTYSQLEPRQMLATTIAHDPGTMIVTIYGDAAGDRVDVTENVAMGQISITVNGGMTQTFDPASVQAVHYYANDGDDSFYNWTSLPSRFGAGAGNDYFYGGSGDDWAFGDTGIDQLFGNGGNDYLGGGDGNDTIEGGDGNDELHGGNDDDLLRGDAGDDELWGEFGDDTLEGGDGVDAMYGFSGNDDLSGGLGDDLVYGQGHDDIVRGNEGNDRVRGNNGNDTLYGGDGDDFMMADHGDDVVYGEGGADIMLSHYGTDRMYGGDGDDLLVGEYDTNELWAGEGNDQIIGGSGVDYAYGEGGNDLIYGRDGNDELYGGAGVDRLLGDNGDDALYGGEMGAADTLIGGADDDRFIFQANDIVSDQQAGDAMLEFVDHTSSWNDAEIMVLTEAFRKLYDAVGNNVLLKESLNDDNLRLIKYDDLNGAAGINSLQTQTSWYWENGEPVYTYTYQREIQIVDWDETSQFYNDQFVSVVIHEFAHNWDSDFELAAVSSQLESHWNTFLGLSGWTDTNPYDNNYSLSNDGQWWYLSTADFAENYGRTNPNEDMATVFEYYFSEGTSSANPVLNDKLTLLDSIFDELSLLA